MMGWIKQYWVDTHICVCNNTLRLGGHRSAPTTIIQLVTGAGEPHLYSNDESVAGNKSFRSLLLMICIRMRVMPGIGGYKLKKLNLQEL